jgi:AcrR family transcriptional regulator
MTKNNATDPKDSSPKQPYHHGALREALLKGAREAIAAGGVEGLSSRGLAREIGVSASALYRHFANKNELLVALATEGFAQLTTRMRQSIEDEQLDPIAKLKKIGEVYISFGLGNRDIYPLMFNKSIVDHCSHEELSIAGDQAFGVLLEMVVGAIESGAFKQLDPEMIAVSFWALVHGYVTLLFDTNLGSHCSPEEMDLIIQTGVESLAAGFGG